MATCYTVRLVVGRLVEVKRLTIFIITGVPRRTTEVFSQLSSCYSFSVLPPRTIGTKVTLSPRVLLLLPTYGQSTIISLISCHSKSTHLRAMNR
jgi:hypothetical protein